MDKSMAPVLRDRLTVVGSVYHQSPTEEADGFEAQFSRWLETCDQPYRRHTAAGEAWQPLDCGWLKEVGMLVVRNDEGRFQQTVLDESEKAEVSGKVLELGFAGAAGSWLVLPGESFCGCPAAIAGLQIRCRQGTARFTVFAVPK